MKISSRALNSGTTTCRTAGTAKDYQNHPPAPPPNDAIIALVINACVAIWISVLITVSPEEEKYSTSHL